MRTKFAKDEYYHIYNRGVEKRKIFLDVYDYERFIITLELMNDEQDGLMILWRDYKETKPNAQIKDFLRLNLRKERKKLVEIICYCLNQNHYHLILKQISERGVERFMQRLGTGHTMYFNKKNLCQKSVVLDQFKDVREYEKFCKTNIFYLRDKKEVERYLLES